MKLCYSEDISIAEMCEEREKIKNATIEALLNYPRIGFGKREKEYWKLYKQGMKNKDIAKKMNIEQSSCRCLKMRVETKIMIFTKNLKETLAKNEVLK